MFLTLYRIKWLSTKVSDHDLYHLTFILNDWQGYDFRDAVDGRDGVSVYETEGPFEYVSLPGFLLTWREGKISVVLLDLSMPVLDGLSSACWLYIRF